MNVPDSQGGEVECDVMTKTVTMRLIMT